MWKLLDEKYRDGWLLCSLMCGGGLTAERENEERTLQKGTECTDTDDGISGSGFLVGPKCISFSWLGMIICQSPSSTALFVPKLVFCHLQPTEAQWRGYLSLSWPPWLQVELGSCILSPRPQAELLPRAISFCLALCSLYKRLMSFPHVPGTCSYWFHTYCKEGVILRKLTQVPQRHPDNRSSPSTYTDALDHLLCFSVECMCVGFFKSFME